MVIDEQDSELVHPIGRNLYLGNSRRGDELDTYMSSPRRPSLENNRNRLSWCLDDGCHRFKISGSNALPVGRGRRGEEVDVMEEQDLELVVEEKVPCSDNRDREMNLMWLRRVPDLKNNDDIVP